VLLPRLEKQPWLQPTARQLAAAAAAAAVAGSLALALCSLPAAMQRRLLLLPLAAMHRCRQRWVQCSWL
jgi:anti-sigma factor RsiW